MTEQTKNPVILTINTERGKKINLNVRQQELLARFYKHGNDLDALVASFTKYVSPGLTITPQFKLYPSTGTQLTMSGRSSLNLTLKEYFQVFVEVCGLSRNQVLQSINPATLSWTQFEDVVEVVKLKYVDPQRLVEVMPSEYVALHMREIVEKLGVDPAIVADRLKDEDLGQNLQYFVEECSQDPYSLMTRLDETAFWQNLAFLRSRPSITEYDLWTNILRLSIEKMAHYSYVKNGSDEPELIPDVKELDANDIGRQVENLIKRIQSPQPVSCNQIQFGVCPQRL